MIRWSLVVAVSAGMALAAPAAAQSLGDLARQEEARRASQKSSKVYTNSDLKADGLSVVASSATTDGYFSISLNRYVTADEMVSRSRQKIEADDRLEYEPIFFSEGESLRRRVARIHKEMASLNAIATGERRSDSERAMASRMLDERTATLELLQKQWARLEENLKALGRPITWMGAPPQFFPSAP